MPASHNNNSVSPRASGAPPRAFGAPADNDDPMDILRCLLFAGTVTLVIALVVRATRALDDGSSSSEEKKNDYAVEWLLLGLALGRGVLLYAEARGPKGPHHHQH